MYILVIIIVLSAAKLPVASMTYSSSQRSLDIFLIHRGTTPIPVSIFCLHIVFGIPFTCLTSLVLFFLSENSFWKVHFILLQEGAKFNLFTTLRRAVMHGVSEHSMLLVKRCQVKILILSHGDVRASHHFLKSHRRWRCCHLCTVLTCHERRFLAVPAVLLFSYKVPAALRKNCDACSERVPDLFPDWVRVTAGSCFSESQLVTL